NVLSILLRSLWDPNITVCYKKSEVEVSFTPSNFSTTYTILLCESDECSDHIVDTSKVCF
uniref:Uncharacterized protein n=1 Tax=Varanus komodoensis TaxID=61221 RepID=A0A8D2KYM3_VARKO